MALASDPERLLKAGVYALKQKHYDRARAAFQQLQAETVPPAIRLKAQMGLVQTYRDQGDLAAASQICADLAHSRSSHIRTWAKEQLTQLQLSQVTAHPSGGQPPGAALKAADKSGFQPIADAPAEPAADLAGFQPIEPQPAASQPDAIPTSRPVSLPLGPEPPEPPEPPESPEPTLRSMFQYDTLNQPGTPRVVSSEPASEPQAPAASAVSLPADWPVGNPETAASPGVSPELGWQMGSRLKTGRSLGKVGRNRFWLAQMVSAVVAFGLLRYLLHTGLRGVNGYLTMLDRILPVTVRPVGWFYLDHTWRLLAVLLGLGLAMPWLWDLWLRWQAEAQPGSTRLLTPHSPEAVQLMRKICLQRNWPFPTLKLLPTPVPVMFSYGWLPRFGRLVVSQGLLDRLSDDEIAALLAYELSHWRGWDWPLLSLVGLILQVCHWGYWALARWGNGQKRLVKLAAGLLATVCYGVVWLLQKSVCWVARLRPYFRDRAATELTGNPNGLARALGKLSFDLAETVAEQGYTPPLIESLALLLPVGAASTLPLYAERHRQPLGQLFAWDTLNPWRAWLSVNQPQPPLGDRLRVLMAYSRHWRLTPAVEFAAAAPPVDRWRLLLQAGPWTGLVTGIAIGLLLWGVGAIALGINLSALGWLYRDLGVLQSAALLGLGTGALLRMNAFFPDLIPPPPAADLENWLVNSSLLPLDGPPTTVTGQLLGRPGLANWLGQDLLLQTPSGLLKLHFVSLVGPIGNAWGRGLRPSKCLGQTVRITGWLRRGHQAWLDVATLHTDTGNVTAQHPAWSLVLTTAAVLLGLWILVRGA